MRDEISPTIFRAYDIRGIEGEDLDARVAEMIGKGFGTYISKTEDPRPTVAVGRDNRVGSVDLQAALINGLLSTGCNVIDIGLSLSPMMYFAVAKWGVSGGVNVTGSHNPSGYNGFKMVRKGPVPIAEEEIQELRRLISRLLEQDPRPAYLEGGSQRSEFGMRLLDYNIRWRLAGGVAEVISIATVDEK